MRVSAILALPLALSAGIAHAQPYDGGWRLSARARSICEVSAASAPQARVAMLDLGVVREACNSGNGYRVELRFDNLVGGVLEIGDTRVTIPDSGVVVVNSTKPQWRNLQWRVRDPVYASVTSDIVVTFLISPSA